jgi:phage portal protein BeeE
VSWLTSAIRDLQSDQLAGDHKIRYWSNGATPNLVIKGLPAVTRSQFDELVDMMEERHAGAANAFRTLYLTQGADASVIGNNFHEIDFRGVTAAGETRISVLSRVPASLLGITEGLQGSTLNTGNFSAARRTFADTWVYPTLQDLSKSLAPLVKVPNDAELWYDVTDIGLLREDAKDQAEIDSVKAGAIRNLVDGGFEPETAIKTIAPEWAQSLKHTGNVSVQLQPPGAHLTNANEVGQFLQPHNG